MAVAHATRSARPRITKQVKRAIATRGEQERTAAEGRKRSRERREATGQRGGGQAPAIGRKALAKIGKLVRATKQAGRAAGACQILPLANIFVREPEYQLRLSEGQ